MENIKTEMKITSDINSFINDLNNGKVVCFKTDTIWGLSANPNNFEALKNLYEIKKRSLDKPLIFLIKQNEKIEKITQPLSNFEKDVIKKYWPGPVSIIFNINKKSSYLDFYENKKTIALRQPKNEICQTILNKIDYPLPSTSVNIEGEKPINNFVQIKKFLKNKDVTILKIKNYNRGLKSSALIKIENNKVVFLRK